MVGRGHFWRSPPDTLVINCTHLKLSPAAEPQASTPLEKMVLSQLGVAISLPATEQRKDSSGA